MRLSRRQFVTLAGTASGAGLAAVGWRAAHLELRVESFDVPVADLPLAFDGFRIAVVADVHTGPNITVPEMERAAQLADDQSADVAVFLGDMIDERGTDRDIRNFVAVFGSVRARHGIVAVAGNHEHLAGLDRIARAFDAAGIHLLRDEDVTLRRQGTELTLLVVDDPAVREFDPPQDASVAAAAGRCPADSLPILLAHRPGAFDAAVRHGIPLTLSGHTHGGQIGLPIRDVSPTRFLTRYVRGAYERDGSHLIVSSGVGTSTLPFRVGVAPAVTVVRLVTS